MIYVERWIKLLMSCVLTITYSFVINDSVCEEVNPLRDLREGDLLSSCLLVMIADAFSSLLRKQQMKE